MSNGHSRSLERPAVQTSKEGRNKTGFSSLPHVKMAPMIATGPTGERQEHLDAVVAFARVGGEEANVQGARYAHSTVGPPHRTLLSLPAKHN